MWNRTHFPVLLLFVVLPCLEAYSLEKTATIQMENSVSSISYSPNSRHMLIDTYEDEHVLYDLKSGKKTRIKEPGMYISFSPHSRYLYSISEDSKAYNIYDVEKNETHYSITNITKTNTFRFSPSGRFAALSFRDKTVRYIDLEGKKPIKTITHKQQIKSADFTPDGKYIISASWEDDVVGVYSIKEKKVVKAFAAPDQGDVRISSNSRFLILGPSKDRKGIISIVDLKNMTQTELDADDEFPVVYLSPDSRYLAITERETKKSDKPIDLDDIFDLDSLSTKATTTVTLYNLATKQVNEIFTGYGWQVCTFSNDGRYLLLNFSVGSATEIDKEARSARVYDLNTLKQQLVVEHKKKITDASFSPDGKSLITASDDKTVKVFDIARNKTVDKIDCEQKPVSAMFSPDSKLVMIGLEDETTKVYDPKSKTILKSFKAEFVGLFGFSLKESIEFSPNSEYFAILDKGNSVVVYKVAN